MGHPYGDDTPQISNQNNSILGSHSFTLVFGIAALLCVTTRVYTSLRSTIHNQDVGTPSKPRDVGVVPYWVPWLGHAVPFALGIQSYLEKLR